MATCQDCGKQIHFLTLKGGKDTGSRMPVEAEPHRDGNLRVNLETGQYRFANDQEYELWRVKSPKAIPLHISHFARCPNAGKFRKGKRKK
jgi:hypothetical protein